MIDSKNLRISKCTITNNVSSFYGGAAFFSDCSSGDIVNTIISKNRANQGGGIYTASEVDLDIINCTISQNSAINNEGGICASSPSSSYPVRIKNSIIWVNFPKEISNYSSYLQITYSCIKGGYNGAGNIKCDPLFLEPDAENYYIKDSSCCINAGNSTDAPEDDREGIVREQTIDIGAYEYIPGSSCKTRALFSPCKVSGVTPLAVVFDASLSGGIESNDDPNQFVWNFGDGSQGTGTIVSHTYTQHGAYTVSLTVSNTCGAPHILTVPDCVKAKAGYPVRDVGKGASYREHYRFLNKAGE